MTDSIEARAQLGESARWVGAARIAIGLVQGLILYLIVRDVSQEGDTWLKDHPTLLAPLLMVGAYIPVLLLAGVGRIRPLVLGAWVAGATALVWMMAWWLAERSGAGQAEPYPVEQAGIFLVIPFAAVALFIGHNLIAAADRARRAVAPYPDYFDLAWKHGVQLALSLAFTGSVWLLLGLGTALFSIIGLKFLQELVVEPWFNIPVTTLAFALAVQLTDVRDGLIRGVRAVALMLLSWLLILMTVLAAGFVIALPFTGLEGLWETGSATALVLFAAASLIVLINAAYQDGREENRPPLVLRWTVRVAAVLLTPLVLIAVWGLALRVGQHGWTPDRIIAAAFTLVGAVYAGGYGLAALRTGGWMRPLEPTNVLNAAVAFVLIALLSSPPLDPTRLSVMDQVARLERGAVKPSEFDFDFLRWESGKAGTHALERLSRSSNAEVARLAREALAQPERSWRTPTTRTAQPNIVMIPEGAAVPAGLADAVKRSGTICLDRPCHAVLRNIDGDEAEEALVRTPYEGVMLLSRGADGKWRQVGTYHPANPCGARTADDAGIAAQLGSLRPAAPLEWPDLGDLAGTRWRFTPECADVPSPPEPKDR